MNVGVIGAGVFGLASAIELRARGHAVTIFDQGTVPYEAASSTDVSKAIRRTWYAGDNETYVELVERAAEQWREWEERSGKSFYHKVGGAYVVNGIEPGSPMDASVDYLRSRGAEIAVLTAPEARERFPQIRIDDHELCVNDPWTGYIESARAVSVMCLFAREEGVSVREESPVVAVEERAGHVDIALGDGEHVGFDRVVVAVGVWIGRLLPEIGAHVRVTHQEMLLIEPPDPAQFAGGTMPVWSINPDDEGWYGFPLLREGYAKAAIDPPGDTVDPDLDRSAGPRGSGSGRWPFSNAGFPTWPGEGSSGAARASTPPLPTTTSSSTGPQEARESWSRAAGAATGSSSGAQSARWSPTHWRTPTTHSETASA